LSELQYLNCFWLQETDLPAVVHYFMVAGLFQVYLRKFMGRVVLLKWLKRSATSICGIFRYI